MNTHIVYFMGGFANQIFQLCLYNRIKEDNREDIVLADISFYKKNNDHGGYKLKHYFQLEYCDKLSGYDVVIDETNYDSCYNDTHYDGKVILYKGYWQGKKFFPHDMSFLNSIKQLRNVSIYNQRILDNICNKESVSIHIRRGDYINNRLHGNIANEQYYRNSVLYIKNVLPEAVFFVFSDDIDWCKEHFQIIDSEVFYVEGNSKDVLTDLLMMSKCKHNIIANSSFSWWAQELNDNVNKIVISPEYWFNEHVSGNELNLNSFVHISNVPIIQSGNSSPFFSIIIAIHNKEYTMRRCLASVLNQTYENNEIIIIDDCSTDNSYAILSEYEKRDKRIKLIRNETNKSVYASRLLAMKHVKGEYVLFVDGDDYLNLNACKKIFDIINNKHIDILEFAYRVEPENIIVQPTSKEITITRIIRREIGHNIWNKCFSKELIQRYIQKADDFYSNMSEDLYMYLVLYDNSDSYDSISDALYHYVTLEGISTKGEMTKDTIINIINSINNRRDSMSKYLIEKDENYEEDYKYGELIEMRDMAYRITTANISIPKKIEYLEMFDRYMGTRYSEEYSRYLEDASLLYTDFKKGLRKQLRYIIKHITNKG